MQGVVGGAFLLPSSSSTAIPTQNLNIFFNPLSFKSYKSANFPSSSLPLTRTGVLSISASSKRRTGDSNAIGASIGDKYGEEMMMLSMPFDEMRRWLNNKPPGFGERKTYDTSIEERRLSKVMKGVWAKRQRMKKKNESDSKKHNQKMSRNTEPSTVADTRKFRPENIKEAKQDKRQPRTAQSVIKSTRKWRQSLQSISEVGI